MTDRWALRDSNWSIDFPQAARTIAWFYHEETGQTVDGVIGVTAHAGQRLVQTLGPLPMSDGSLLTADEFYNTLQYSIEKAYFLTPEHRAENEPKTILADLVRTAKHRLLLPTNFEPVADWLGDQLATKDIVVAFFDERQRAVEQAGWADRIDGQVRHYLSLNNANLGGMKSSRFMTQAVQLAITDAGTGPATYQLTLRRTHHGTGTWPDHTNSNLTRIVLPAGATPMTATLDGMPVSPSLTEAAATRSVFGFQIDTEPGTSRLLEATFAVPVDQSLRPQFVWQKQPGVSADDVTVQMNGRALIHGSIDRDVTVPLEP